MRAKEAPEGEGVRAHHDSGAYNEIKLCRHVLHCSTCLKSCQLFLV